MTAREILQRTPGASVGLGLALVVLLFLCGCVIGVPFFGGVAVMLLGVHVQAATGLGERRFSMAAALLYLLFVLLLAVGAGVGVALGAGLARDPGVAIGLLLGPFLVGLALSPFLLVPLVLVDPTMPDRWGAASARGLELAHRVGLRRWVRIVAVLVGVFFAPLLAMAFFDRQPGVFFAMPLAWWLGFPLASATLVATYADVRGEVAATPAAGRWPAGLRVLLGISGAVALVALGLLVAVLALPSPMETGPAPTGRELVPWTEGPVRLPGTSVRVTPDVLGVRVEAADGGGAGLVEWPYATPDSLRVLEGRDGTFRVEARDYALLGHVTLDAQGVRLDDGVGARMEARLGTVGQVLLGLGLLGLVGAFFAFRGVIAARVLEAVRATDDLDDGEGHAGRAAGRRALEGRLRVPEGEQVEVAGQPPRVRGHAWVEGGELRVALPEGGAPLPAWVDEASQDAVADGALVAVVGHFERLGAEGLREGGRIPWPAGGLLVPGG
ncbi:MAG: hypothetical protein CMH59_17825, partial [Myxococcales bacterium]|nr:hypothetical protein [Myxococcales bacterium]